GLVDGATTWPAGYGSGGVHHTLHPRTWADRGSFGVVTLALDGPGVQQLAHTVADGGVGFDHACLLHRSDDGAGMVSGCQAVSARMAMLRLRMVELAKAILMSDQPLPGWASRRLTIRSRMWCGWSARSPASRQAYTPTTTAPATAMTLILPHLPNG